MQPNTPLTRNRTNQEREGPAARAPSVPSYAKPSLEPAEEIPVAPDVGLSILIITAADLIIITGANIITSNLGASSSTLDSTAPFAEAEVGDTFTVTFDSATLASNGVIEARYSASFSSQDLFFPGPLDNTCPAAGFGYFAATAAIEVSPGNIVYLGDPGFSEIEQCMTGDNGQVDLVMTMNAAGLGLNGGETLYIAVWAGGDVAFDNSAPATMNTMQEIGGTLALPTPTLPWAVAPAIGAAGALALRRRRRGGSDANDSGEDGEDRGGGFACLLVSWDWMRRRKGVRVVSRKLE